MNPEFKRVNVNFGCFCSSVAEQTGLPFVKRTSESSFAEAYLKVCETNEPHLQDEHHLKIMKDMKFKTLPHVKPINRKYAIDVTSAVGTRLNNAATTTGDKTRCFQWEN